MSIISDRTNFNKMSKYFLISAVLVVPVILLLAGCGYKDEIEHLKSEIGQIKGELQKTEESIAIFSKDLALVKNDLEVQAKEIERLGQKLSNEKQQNIQSKAKPKKKKRK